MARSSSSSTAAASPRGAAPRLPSALRSIFSFSTRFRAVSGIGAAPPAVAAPLPCPPAAAVARSRALSLPPDLPLPAAAPGVGDGAGTAAAPSAAGGPAAASSSVGVSASALESSPRYMVLKMSSSLSAPGPVAPSGTGCRAACVLCHKDEADRQVAPHVTTHTSPPGLYLAPDSSTRLYSCAACCFRVAARLAARLST